MATGWRHRHTYLFSQWHGKPFITFFAQNEEIKQVLVNTGNKRLVESSYDQVWGTGIPLSDQSCLDKSKWTSPGILSKLLMDICSKLRPDTESPTTGKEELMDVTSKEQDQLAG